jgi:hypothetical protein
MYMFSMCARDAREEEKSANRAAVSTQEDMYMALVKERIDDELTYWHYIDDLWLTGHTG